MASAELTGAVAGNAAASENGDTDIVTGLAKAGADIEARSAGGGPICTLGCACATCPRPLRQLGLGQT